MNYFAKIFNGYVEAVILVSNTIENGVEWCVEQYGGEWVQTFLDDPNKVFANIGYKYDEDTQNFIAPDVEPVEP